MLLERTEYRIVLDCQYLCIINNNNKRKLYRDMSIHIHLISHHTSQPCAFLSKRSTLTIPANKTCSENKMYHLRVT